MSSREGYRPGPAAGARVDKGGERWLLVVERELRHAPEKVWRAITDPSELREWAPFDADRSLDGPGPVKLSTVGAPQVQVSETRVTRAEAPHLLEYDWGGQSLRWQLEALPAGGTRLTLWHAIDPKYIAMGAAGWHICLDVMDHLLAGDPLGRIVGADAMKFEWPRLHTEYSALFGTTPPQA